MSFSVLINIQVLVNDTIIIIVLYGLSYVHLMFGFFLLEQESLLEAFYALGDDGTHVSFVLS